MGVQGVAWGWTCWGLHGRAWGCRGVQWCMGVDMQDAAWECRGLHGGGHAGGCMGVQGSAMVENKINTAAKVHEA